MKKFFMLCSLLVASVANAAPASHQQIEKALKNLGIEQAEIQPAPIAGLKTVIAPSMVLYVSEDGKYVLQGPLYDISQEQPLNVTNQLLVTRLESLKHQMIIFKAPQEKHIVTVFTDITCGYCHKLHNQMAEYNALGITIRYLAFPRQGMEADSARDMKSIWCNSNRNKVFNSAMKGNRVPMVSCDIDISQHYQLGVQFGVKGTPAIILANGVVIPGYQEPAQLSELLESFVTQAAKK
ncbi:bifunctional protein-disulfide isomerase/oxidoreductase DsbC [Serratia microhaemolytica]|uniref:bifunctional protein-disulfide isomerase/oxidoreductase DsbC n=1 Tax=Serratia microhaemolytica TaxID=2675110 RepID=UPI000FDEA316|nr:bifunctional protein-disulfide isomerase/oxidoreductase DsbC [Serratia microhaemolytica]